MSLTIIHLSYTIVIHDLNLFIKIDVAVVVVVVAGCISL